ncbi:MAG TPA: S16 family serine protease, partial [Planctomycetota bacterium]|nr:S16 family serine protease [Planctomycetota bacterium]
MSDPFTIDTAAALTGDVSVEGRVLQVGGTHAKIRGALLGACKRVGIPTANEGDLADAIILYGMSSLMEIEVVGLQSIDDAVAFARVDRDAKAVKASTEFAALRALAEQKSKGNADPSVTEAIQKLTDSILADSPRHLSARMIDLWNNRKLALRLSLANSLDAAHDLLLGYLQLIRRGDQPSFADIAHETTTANITSVLDRLRVILPKLHVDAQKPADKLEQCCLSLQRFVYLRGDVEKKQKKVEE